MSEPRFLADDMLARLARWLRGAGIDVAALPPGVGDDVILRAARKERRVVLTRDSRFPGGDRERIVLESPDLDEQLADVLRRCPGFDPLARPFSRCMECNGSLRDEANPPDRPADVPGPFTRCAECGRLYWAGSHVERILERLSRARDRAREQWEKEAQGEPPPFERKEYDAFLREAIDLLGLSWRGYRRVRLGLRTRVRQRLRELGMRALPEYLDRVRRDPRERDLLGSLLHVTVSRFFRDRETWLRLPELVFPGLLEAAGGSTVRVWSLGCASGEEPFTLQMIWSGSPLRESPLEVLAVDLSDDCLRRARAGVYPESSVHNVPEPYLGRHFRRTAGGYVLDRAVADAVRFEPFDWRAERWPGPFHWVLARNGPFTYLNRTGRERALGKIASALEPGGFLWVGGNERLPEVRPGWKMLAHGLFRVPGPEAAHGA